jgi:XRE family transcriptional regulator, regulator of sulfur utilization
MSNKLGEVLKHFRTNKKITLLQLSEMTELSISYLSIIESNQRKPNIDILERICQSLDVPLEVLLILSSDSDDPLVRDKLKPLILEIAEDLYGYEPPKELPKGEFGKGILPLSVAAASEIMGNGNPYPWEIAEMQAYTF